MAKASQRMRKVAWKKLVDDGTIDKKPANGKPSFAQLELIVANN